eukprot:m.3333 g.3333  ORF g.3333 m.3333 type:complete len:171 (+) comp9272_c0_seq2:126-638(+)
MAQEVGRATVSLVKASAPLAVVCFTSMSNLQTILGDKLGAAARELVEELSPWLAEALKQSARRFASYVSEVVAQLVDAGLGAAAKAATMKCIIAGLGGLLCGCLMEQAATYILQKYGKLTPEESKKRAEGFAVLGSIGGGAILGALLTVGAAPGAIAGVTLYGAKKLLFG